MGSKVVILPKEHEEKRYEKIIIADNFNLNKDLAQGEIILVSANVTNVKPGETVLYPKSAATSLVWDNITYAIVNGPTKESLGDIWLVL